MGTHICSLKEVRRGSDEGAEFGSRRRDGEGMEMVAAWACESGEDGETETRSVLPGERGTRQTRAQSGGRSCDGVTRNKSDI